MGGALPIERGLAADARERFRLNQYTMWDGPNQIKVRDVLNFVAHENNDQPSILHLTDQDYQEIAHRFPLNQNFNTGLQNMHGQDNNPLHALLMQNPHYQLPRPWRR
jgi:hypothetical protein